MIWHYTVGQHFISILEEGEIRTTTAYLAPGEKPIAWFSTEQFWEPTVTKGLRTAEGAVQNLGMQEQHEGNFLLCRLGVDEEVAPYRWRELKQLSGMPPHIAAGLARVAKHRGGNPSRWRGSFAPVCCKDWKALQFFNGIEWDDFPAEVGC
jgi:hypothetical protein